MSKIVIAASVLALGFSAGAYAADGTINITGKIIGTTCTINGAASGSAAVNVTLPVVLASTLNGSGKTAGTTAFAINLTNCDSNIATAGVSFQPGSTIASDGTLINSGTANKVSVALLNASGTQINLSTGANNNLPVTLTNGAGSLNYSAQYLATGNATSGTVTTSVTFNLAYT